MHSLLSKASAQTVKPYQSGSERHKKTLSRSNRYIKTEIDQIPSNPAPLTLMSKLCARRRARRQAVRGGWRVSIFARVGAGVFRGAGRDAVGWVGTALCVRVKLRDKVRRMPSA